MEKLYEFPEQPKIDYSIVPKAPKLYTIVRSKFMLPMTDKCPGVGEDGRISDGYILSTAGKIVECGKYSSEIGESILSKYGEDLEIVGASVESPRTIPKLEGILMPGFVKAHGHDHESPIVGIAKDCPLTEWLDRAVNPSCAFYDKERTKLTEMFGCSPNLIIYLKARLDDLQHGITSALTHHCNFNKYRGGDLVHANVLAGTKMIAAIGAQDRLYDKRILDTPEIAVKRMDTYESLYGDAPRTSIIPGPDQLFSNGPELLKALKKWSVEKKRLIHIHSSEEKGT
ncbi:Atrazine chlorohydrolase, partial [Aduncisulcus paluster]